MVALSSTLGWITFLIFGGIGLSAFPIDLIVSFFTRPKATITKTEYINQARFLAQHAREIKNLGEELKKEERESGRTRRWRRNFKELNKQLLILEDMNQELESKYPQVRRPSKSTCLAHSFREKMEKRDGSCIRLASSLSSFLDALDW